MADALAVVAGRQFWVHTKAYASGNAFPADTVLYGATFTTAGYTKLGYTAGGLGMAWNLQRGAINVDQELDPVMRPVQSRQLTLDSNLAEFTPANILLATGQGDIVTNELAAVTGVKGHHQIDVSSDVVEQYNTIIFDIRQQNGEALRIAAWRGLATGSPSPRIEPNNPAILAYQVSALPDSSVSPARIASVRLVQPGT
jgi:hypothetical protein